MQSSWGEDFGFGIKKQEGKPIFAKTYKRSYKCKKRTNARTNVKNVQTLI